MMLKLIIGILIFAITLGTILVRPYRISEALAAAVGALLMLLAGILPPIQALQVLKSEWNIYGFFLGLMTISAIADQAGIFNSMAAQAGHWAGGSSRKLYLGIFTIGVMITALLSNDATALILTPAVYALVTRLRLPALPFMFACTFIADTASFLLPVSNPINILVLDQFGGGLGIFLHYLLLPALFCISLNTALFFWLFRSDLRHSYDVKDLPTAAPPDRPFFRFTLVSLGIIGAAFVLASAFQFPLSLVALAGAILLLFGARRFGYLQWNRLRKEISWSLFIFISGMFLVIQGVDNLGLTDQFGSSLIRLAGSSPLRAILFSAAGSALGANLINNVPMALVMISALRAIHAGATANSGLIYATILGCDLGPNLTTVGSLATILWLLILRRKGLEISSLEYFKLGILVVPVMIVVSAILIWLVK
jgi:arsenical pump membrane protein